MTNYYHYTDQSGRQAIKSSGFIKESVRLDAGDDAVFGRGVYLTSLPPSAGKRKIVETCWGPNFYPRLVQQGRVDYVFRVRLPQNKVTKGTKKREVYLYQGKLILNDYDWDDFTVPDKE